MPALRTLLFAPGNHPRKVEKVFGLKADAVILDLEDAVAISEKEATRAPVLTALQNNHSQGDNRSLGYVRVNSMDTDFCFADLHHMVATGVDGIVLPKVESSQQLFAAEWMITSLEAERGITPGSIDLVPIIETARGLRNINDICGSGTRVKRLAFGAADYTIDVNMDWSNDEFELEHARTAIAVACRAAGLEPPIDSVWVEIKDEPGFLRSCERARKLGYQGKMCIYPPQIQPGNDAFSPTAGQLEQARRIIDAFEQAEREGSASIQLDGQFIDYPIVEKARRVIALATQVSGNSA